MGRQGYCGIKYAVCTSNAYSFGLTSTDATANAATALLDQTCATDWIQIPCASDQANSALTVANTGCASKICGANLAAAAAAPSVSIYSKLLINRNFQYYVKENYIVVLGLLCDVVLLPLFRLQEALRSTLLHRRKRSIYYEWYGIFWFLSRIHATAVPLNSVEQRIGNRRFQKILRNVLVVIAI